MGVALRDLHRFDEALQQFALAIDIDPNYAAARTNRAQTNLLLGHFTAGWREYEWRWLDGGTPHGFDPEKLWTGEQPIAGKTVLAHSEQGMGDTLQFVRYVDRLALQGARVVLRVQNALLPLLREYPGTAQVIGENDAVPGFDLHCPLLSLPLAFKTDATNIPASDSVSSCGSAESYALARNDRRQHDQPTPTSRGNRLGGLAHAIGTRQPLYAAGGACSGYWLPMRSSCRCRKMCRTRTGSCCESQNRCLM